MLFFYSSNNIMCRVSGVLINFKMQRCRSTVMDNYGLVSVHLQVKGFRYSVRKVVYCLNAIKCI